MKKTKLCILMLPFLLLGCKSNKNIVDPTDNEEETGYIKENVTIGFLCMADSSFYPTLQSIITDFKEVEPKVTVNLYNPLGTGKYAMIEKTVISGFYNEDYPDITQCYPDNVVKYLSKGYVVNIDKYLNNSEYGIASDSNDYIESYFDEGKGYSVEGTYSLPFCKSTEFLYYNADVLLGLDLSSVDSTINEGKPLDASYLDNLSWEVLFETLCPAIYKYNESLPANEKIYVNDDKSGIVTYDSDENFFITLANQYGYGYTSIKENGEGSVDFDNDGMKNLMKRFQDYRNKGYLQTRGTNNNEYVSSLFTSKKALFTISSTASNSYNYNRENPFVIGAAKLPFAEGKNDKSINQGPSICILDHHDENRSLASYLFWKFMTNKENCSKWALKTGYIVIRESTATTEEYQKELDITGVTDKYKISVANNLKKITEASGNTFTTDVFRGSSNCRTNVGKLLTQCLLSDDLDSKIDSLFKSYSDDAKNYLK